MKEVLNDLNEMESVLQTHLKSMDEDSIDAMLLNDALKAIMHATNHFVLRSIYEGDSECKAI